MWQYCLTTYMQSLTALYVTEILFLILQIQTVWSSIYVVIEKRCNFSNGNLNLVILRLKKMGLKTQHVHIFKTNKTYITGFGLLCYMLFLKNSHYEICHKKFWRPSINGWSRILELKPMCSCMCYLKIISNKIQFLNSHLLVYHNFDNKLQL